ncbi:MAG: phytanoyl-CoA dioxygenase family protein [Acidimicrobiia bacterium]
MAQTDIMTSLNRMPADSDITKIIEVIKSDGGLILTGLIDPSIAAKIESEISDAVSHRKPGFIDSYDDSFYGKQTVRVQSMARRSRTWVDEVLLNPVLLSIADEILLPHCGDYWLSQSETIYLGPGQAAQELHRDDLNWPVPAQLENVDLQLACLIAVGDYDKEVGATQVIPGSHLWDKDRQPQQHEIIQAEMDLGDALIYTGSLIHSGGENKTSNRWRKALYQAFLVGWLTPEEAVPMGIPHEVAKTLPKRAQELLGLANLPNCADSTGAQAALHLWSLDKDDLDAADGAFHHR